MKKAVLLLVCLLLLQIASAYEIKLTKESYWQGETLQAEIIGLDNLKQENIFLYRDEAIPTIYDFTRLQGKHYLYMILPDKIGNYSIKLKDVLIDNENLGDVEKEFVIKSSNQSYISINPGFIITERDFSVEVKNKGSVSLEVIAEYDDQKKSEKIAGKGIKKFRFNVGETGILKINEYEIPIVIIKTSGEKEEELKQVGNLKFIPNIIDSEIPVGRKWQFDFTLVNSGEEKIENITIEYEDKYGLEVEPYFFEEISKRDVVKGDISFKLDKEGEIEFKIIAKAEDTETEMLVKIKSIENISKIIPGPSYESCEEMEGVICNVTIEECDVGEKWTNDEKWCCVGECVEKEKEGGRGWIGWIIIVVVILGVGGFIFFKLRKSKSKTAEDVIKERQKAK